MYSNNPWRDEQARQDAMEAYSALFPVCATCGRSLVNCDTVVLMERRFSAENWYCDECSQILTFDELKERLGID